MSTLGSEPAYPTAVVVPDGDDYLATGLTKRELFAAMAMQALLSDGERTRAAASALDDGDDKDERLMQVVASAAANMADALLAELAKPQEHDDG